MQASSVKVRMQFLRTALKWAADQKFLPACPRFPPVKAPKKKPQPVPLESFEKLPAKAADQQARVFLQCGWLAGMRLNEALALEWEPADDAPWLDLARNRIWFPAGFVKAVEDQWVPLGAALREAILSLPRRGRKASRFVEARSGKAVGDIAVSHRVSELARAAGVRMTMKTLRQGFGCRYAGQASAHLLRRLMRHSNIRVTMDYYANVDDAVEEAVRRNAGRNKPEPASPKNGAAEVENIGGGTTSGG
jgi:integrase